MIKEYISVKHPQYKMDNKERQEGLLIEKFKNSFKMGDIKEAKDLINTLRSEHKIKQKIKR